MNKIKISSVGKKFIMSISGLFLLLFLTLHMSINLIAVFSLEKYDEACHFMGTNPLIQVMVPVLAIGFAVHVIMAIILALQNKKARGNEPYNTKSKTHISWPSKNMIALGIIVLGLLVVHLNHFWCKMQFQEWIGNEPAKGSELLLYIFRQPTNVIIYTIWILALCFHLIHGFWSAFQSLGVNHPKYILVTKIVCHSYVTLLTAGFLITIFYIYSSQQ